MDRVGGQEGMTGREDKKVGFFQGDDQDLSLILVVSCLLKLRILCKFCTRLACQAKGLRNIVLAKTVQCLNEN